MGCNYRHCYHAVVLVLTMGLLTGCVHLVVVGVMADAAKSWQIKKLEDRVTVLENK